MWACRAQILRGILFLRIAPLPRQYFGLGLRVVSGAGARGHTRLVNLHLDRVVFMGIGKESETSKPSKKFPYVPSAGESRTVGA